MRSIWEARNDPVVAEQLAQHAQALAAAKHNPQLSADVLGLVGFYYARVGDPVRGLDLCREALALTDAHQLRRSRDGVRKLAGPSRGAGWAQRSDAGTARHNQQRPLMKSKGVDRAQMEKMDAAFEPFAEKRPDLLGGLRIWTGADSCIDVAYFTTEAEARKGEQAEILDELEELVSTFEGMGETEDLDLTDPQLR